MLSNKKIVILGGGISGLTVAWRLQELGFQTEVCESNEFVGGLAGTVRPEDGRYCLDFGPHFFITQKQEIVERITDLLADDVVSFERSAQLYVQGRFLDYPLSAKNVLLNFPLSDAIASIITFVWAQLKSAAGYLIRIDSKTVNFGDWATANFGNHLAKIFFRPYTEGFWKIPCENLSPEIIPTSTRLNFMKSLKMMFLKKVSGPAKSLTERELVLPLRYPKRGYGVIAETIANRVLNMGGFIRQNARVVKVELREDGKYLVKVSQDDNEIELNADHVVSTIPIPNLVNMMSPESPLIVRQSADKLGYLSLIVLYVVTTTKDLLDTSYVYYLDRPYHRLAEMDKFCDSLFPAGENMLAVEFSCHRGDEIWNMNEQDLLELALPHLEHDNIILRNEVDKLFVVRAGHAYPIRYLDFRKNLDTFLNYVGEHNNLDVLGRTGEYMYIDSDQCMERALVLADKIAAKLH
ncbi:MAG: hypothetical protein CL789_04450 [Chloroflexi bacterium]|nr:hypothetical protein [Chloroflexota bacterium]MBS59864.1 hypothetical protein [Anaerolineaceae bacterium]HCU80892.1 hypothetical protein [Chloroflexota bacterium]